MDETDKPPPIQDLGNGANGKGERMMSYESERVISLLQQINKTLVSIEELLRFLSGEKNKERNEIKHGV